MSSVTSYNNSLFKGIKEPKRTGAIRKSKRNSIVKEQAVTSKVDKMIRNVFTNYRKLVIGFYPELGKAGMRQLDLLKNNMETLLADPTVNNSIKRQLIVGKTHIIMKNSNLIENYKDLNINKAREAYEEIKSLNFSAIPILDNLKENQEFMINLLYSTAYNIGSITKEDVFAKDAQELKERFQQIIKFKAMKEDPAPIEDMKTSSLFSQTFPARPIKEAYGEGMEFSYRLMGLRKSTDEDLRSYWEETCISDDEDSEFFDTSSMEEFSSKEDARFSAPWLTEKTSFNENAELFDTWPMEDASDAKFTASWPMQKTLNNGLFMVPFQKMEVSDDTDKQEEKPNLTPLPQANVANPNLFLA